MEKNKESYLVPVQKWRAHAVILLTVVRSKNFNECKNINEVLLKQGITE